MDKEQQTTRKLKSILDRQSVDDSTRRSLQSARMTALEGGGKTSGRRWAPAMAIASLLIAVFTVTLLQKDIDPLLPPDEIEDLVVITSEDELELFEDLEFYVWFEQDDKA